MEGRIALCVLRNRKVLGPAESGSKAAAPPCPQGPASLSREAEHVFLIQTYFYTAWPTAEMNAGRNILHSHKHGQHQKLHPWRTLADEG